MFKRAMYGTNDAAQCFDSYCERTMEKLDYNIDVFSPCLYKHYVKDVCVLRHGDDFFDTCDTNSDRGIQGRLEQTFTRETHCNIRSAPQLLDSCEVRFLNRVIRWVVPPFGKAPERIETEADPRHSELLIKNSVLQTNSKGVNTLGKRTRDSSCKDNVSNDTFSRCATSNNYGYSLN